jgi:hypothetical protein
MTSNGEQTEPQPAGADLLQAAEELLRRIERSSELVDRLVAEHPEILATHRNIVRYLRPEIANETAIFNYLSELRQFGKLSQSGASSVRSREPILTGQRMSSNALPGKASTSRNLPTRERLSGQL